MDERLWGFHCVGVIFYYRILFMLLRCCIFAYCNCQPAKPRRWRAHGMMWEASYPCSSNERICCM